MTSFRIRNLIQDKRFIYLFISITNISYDFSSSEVHACIKIVNVEIRPLVCKSDSLSFRLILYLISWSHWGLKWITFYWLSDKTVLHKTMFSVSIIYNTCTIWMFEGLKLYILYVCSCIRIPQQLVVELWFKGVRKSIHNANWSLIVYFPSTACPVMTQKNKGFWPDSRSPPLGPQGRQWRAYTLWGTTTGSRRRYTSPGPGVCILGLTPGAPLSMTMIRYDLL